MVSPVSCGLVWLHHILPTAPPMCFFVPSSCSLHHTPAPSHSCQEQDPASRGRLTLLEQAARAEVAKAEEDLRAAAQEVLAGVQVHGQLGLGWMWRWGGEDVTDSSQGQVRLVAGAAWMREASMTPASLDTPGTPGWGASHFPHTGVPAARPVQAVCCTCAGAGDPTLGSRQFRVVVVDEATQVRDIGVYTRQGGTGAPSTPPAAAPC